MGLAARKLRTTPPAAGGGAADISFLQSASNTADLTTYTFSSANLGVAASDRIIIVAVSNRGSVGQTVSSITVGGVAGAVHSEFASSNNGVALAAAAVPTGTAGDIVVTLSGGASRANIGVWRAVGLNSATPADSDASAGTSTSAVTVAAGGYIIGATTGSSTVRTSWSGGVTEDYDVDVEFMSSAGAHGLFASGSTPTIGWGASMWYAVASWD